MTTNGVSATLRPAATAMLEALAFREILKPLAAGLGPLAETALATVSDALFVRPPA